MSSSEIVEKYKRRTNKAIKFFNDLKKANISPKYIKESGLSNMSVREMMRYFSNKGFRNYVLLVLEREKGVTEYEVYQQARRALEEFEIPYDAFSREDLFNASDERLLAVKKEREQKHKKLLKKMARAANMSFEEAEQFAADMKERYGISLYFCYINQLYDKSDDEIDIIVNSKNDLSQSRIDAVLRETGWTEDQLKEHMAKCSQRFRIGAYYYYSLKCYSLSDEQLSGILVLNDVAKLGKMLNKDPRRIDNKIEFDKRFKDYLGRRTWTNSDTSFDEFSRFADGLSEIFVKPASASCGVGARKVLLADADLHSLYDELMEEEAVVVEELITQHPDMEAFNPSSINTVRIVTIQDGDDVDIVNAYVRFGNGGIVDNYSAGGLECGIDPETGIINTPAVCKTGDVYNEHPISGIHFEGFRIPYWNEAVSSVSSAIRQIDDINYVGWDVAIGPDGVYLVEGNGGPGPGAYQRFLAERGISMKDRFAKYLERAE